MRKFDTLKTSNYRVDDNGLAFDTRTEALGRDFTITVPIDTMKLALEKLGYKVEKKESRFYGVEL